MRDAGHAVSAVLTTTNAQIFSDLAFENVHVMERIPWPKHGYTQPTWERALQEASEAHYDIALIASEEPQAYSFAKLAGIPKRIGFYNGWQKPFKSWWTRRMLTQAVYRPAAQPMHPRHECDVMFDLGAGLHSETTPTTDLRRLRPLVCGSGHRSAGAAIQLTPKWIGPERDVDRVRRWLFETTRSGTWVGFCAQSELSAAIAMRPPNLPLNVFNDVPSWKVAIANVRVLITPDTGAAHVAGMVGTPCVDLFEISDAQRQIARWSPWASRRQCLTFPPAGEDSTFIVALLDAVDQIG